MSNLALVPSSELAAKREELGILHEIFGAMSSGNIRASEWAKAQKVLGYLNGKIEAVQAEADALTPVEADDGNQTPDPDSSVIPDLAKAEASH